MPNLLSYSSVLVHVLGANGVKLSQATAFFYRADNGRLHLVTNWHIVTGRDPQAPSNSRTGAVPQVLRCLMHRVELDKEGREYFRPSQPVHGDLPLNSEDGECPLWKEHPSLRFKVDVVAIDVENDFDKKELLFAPVNEYCRLEPRYEPNVMDDVFVIGFPLGISGSRSQRGAMPVFKRGSIASEPTLDFDSNPCVLIDCRSYSGMSGSQSLPRTVEYGHPPVAKIFAATR